MDINSINGSPIHFCSSPFIKTSCDHQLFQLFGLLLSYSGTGSADDRSALQETANELRLRLDGGSFNSSECFQEDPSLPHKIRAILNRCLLPAGHDTDLHKDLKELVTATMKNRI